MSMPSLFVPHPVAQSLFSPSHLGAAIIPPSPPHSLSLFNPSLARHARAWPVSVTRLRLATNSGLLKGWSLQPQHQHRELTEHSDSRPPPEAEPQGWGGEGWRAGHLHFNRPSGDQAPKV